MKTTTLTFAAMLILGVLLSGCGSKPDGTETKPPPVSANAIPDPSNNGKVKSNEKAAPAEGVAK